MSSAVAESLGSHPLGSRVLDEAYPWRLWLSVAAALAGSLTFGYQTAVLNTALGPVKLDLEYSNEAVLTSALVLGAALGAICAGLIADQIGPKRAQLLNTLILTAGAIVTAVTPYQKYGFLVGRVITGIGAGGASLYAPRYIAEIAPRELRGRLVTQHQLFINAGILCAYLMGIPFQYDIFKLSLLGISVAWWKVMVAAGALPAVIQALLLCFSPESPMWLESRDKEGADSSCLRLWGSRAILFETESEGGEDSEHDILLEDPTRKAPAANEGWLALLKHEYLWMLALALGLPLLQQASGINTVILYSSEVFEDAGLSSPIWGSIFMGVVNLAFTLLASALMDRAGRRPMMLASYAGMSACLLVVGLLNYFDTGLRQEGTFTAVLIMLYVACYALGSGPVTWLYLSEILPTRVKGKVAAVATFLCWMGNFVVAATFQEMTHSISVGGTFIIYALLNLLSFLYCHALMAETKRKTWAQIEHMLLLPPKPSSVWPGPSQSQRSSQDQPQQSLQEPLMHEL